MNESGTTANEHVSSSAPAPAAVPEAPAREVIVERQVAPPAEFRRSAIGPFVAGFLSAILVGAIAVAVFFAVSDADDDGELEVEVPAIDVDVDG